MTRRDPLNSLSSLPANALPVNFSGHALERFAQRLRGGSDPEAVIHELAGMLAAARVTTKRPEWMAESEHRADAFLMLGPDIAAPLVRQSDGELVAATVVFRGMVGDKRRASRNEGNAKGRSRRRMGRTAERVWMSQRRSGPDADEWA